LSGLLQRLGVELPVVQAGLGGGLSGHELAAAVSEAGGLGTVGFTRAETMRLELLAARERTRFPLAANLLLPFARPDHFRAAAAADLLVTFWGRPRRRAPGLWVHQCGSVAEARAARDAGADGVIAQGLEAGGHVRGSAPALELLERVRAELPDGYPVLVAGGMADARDVSAALAAGADAAVLGTRFLLTEESAAHPGYKRRLLDARETLVTELFGLGWPAPHRVVPNAATERWLGRGPLGPGWLRALNRLTAPVASRMQPDLRSLPGRAQSPGLPLFSPLAAVDAVRDELLDATPLYAGESVLRIADVPPAGAVVRGLMAEI
jgi:nitronate monooxygenase